MKLILTLTKNFLDGIIYHTFLAQTSIILLRDIKIKLSWSANSIEPGQTALVAKAIHFRCWQDKG